MINTGPVRREAGVDGPPTQQQSDGAMAAALTDLSATDFNNYFRYERSITSEFYRSLHVVEAPRRSRRTEQARRRSAS